MNNGGPAFPTAYTVRNMYGDAVTEYADGMSLRDYFAAAVLQGIYSNEREDYAATTREDRAVEAYRAADAMLAAREGVES